jgi:fatty acid desaturase
MNITHFFIMVLCCLVPVAALLALSYFQVVSGQALWLAILVLCPVLHLVMMRSMMRGDHERHHPSAAKRKPFDPKLSE